MAGLQRGWRPEHSRSLAALAAAGLSPLQAIEVLRGQYPELARPLQEAVCRLRRGDSLSRSLGESGLFGRNARARLAAAEFGGRLPDALRLIAARSEQQRRRLARLRAQLWLPLTMLLVATLAGLLLKILYYRLSVGTAIVETAVPLGFILLLTAMLFKLLERDLSSWLSWGWRLGLRRSGLYGRLFEFEFYGVLRWLLEAGCDYVQALEQCLALFDNGDYRRRLRFAQRALVVGEDPAVALKDAGLLLTPTLQQLVSSAGAAGRLPEALEHHLHLERQRLDVCLDLFYDWLPRLYYLVIIAIGLRHLLG